MTKTEDASARRYRKLLEHSVGGWIPGADIDGIDENGKWTYWHEWRHLDGRQAFVGPGGRCSDPELEELLRAQASAFPPTRRRWVLMAVREVLVAVRNCGIKKMPEVRDKANLSR
jgi:hypothetical protein